MAGPYASELSPAAKLAFPSQPVCRMQPATAYVDKLAAPIRVANSPRSRDNRAGQIRLPLARRVSGRTPGADRPEIWWIWCERSDLSERVWRQTGPPPERSVERRSFGILEEERDVGDAQAAILKQGARDITTHVIENLAE